MLQIAIEPCVAYAERIAGKPILKLMCRMGLWYGIRHEAGRCSCSSYRDVVGEVPEKVRGRDLFAEGPWQKMTTGAIQFRLSFGKVRLARVCDFGSKEIVVHSISESPDVIQRKETLSMFIAARSEGVDPSYIST